MEKEISFILNGERVTVKTTPNRTLLEILRDELHLTGTKEGCGEGECGACTVIVDGKPVSSCIYLATKANGKNILTIEGMKKDDELHPIQKAFIKAGAIQCGFCTPGMIMRTYSLLHYKSNPTREEIKEEMSGNLCRCTGYEKIFDAIEMVINKEV